MQLVDSIENISFSGKNFVYYVDKMSVYIGLETFFKNILGKLGYSKIERCKQKTDDFFVYKYSPNRQETLVSLDFLHGEFISYEVPEAKFRANKDKYSDYVNFVSDGCLSNLCKLIHKEVGIMGFYQELEMKDISSLMSIIQTEKQEREYAEKVMDEIEKLQQELHDQKLIYKNRATIYEEALEERDNTYEILKDKFYKIQEQNKELASSEITLQEKIERLSKLATEDRLGAFLQRNSVNTYLTIFVIFTFLPFTVGALIRYIPFQAVSMYQTIAFWFLCISMAGVWDLSILYFAKTGMQRMSKIGSVYQFLFFCAEFDLLAVVFSDMLGLDGLYWQKMLVSFCIVSFSAVLVNQFTELSVKKNENG